MTFDKKQIAQSFSKSCHSYDLAAELQRKVGANLLQNLIDTKNEVNGLIVDLGSGTGFFSKKLQEIFPKNFLLAIDISTGMLQYAKEKIPQKNINHLAADADHLPLASDTCSLIFSNLMLQWSNNYQTTLQEICRVLAKDGRCYFSTFGENALQQLRQSWRNVDHTPRVHDFISSQKLTAILQQLPIQNFSFTQETIVHRYSSAMHLMKELKMLGASNQHAQRAKNLLSKSKLQQMLNHYESFRDKKNLLLPATYEIYYGILYK